MNQWLSIAQSALGYLKRIADRLAPEKATELVVSFSGNEDSCKPGSFHVPTPLGTSYNAILLSIEFGTLNIYQGSVSGNGASPPMWWLTCNPTINPLLVPMTQRGDRTVTLAVDPSSSQNLKGTVTFMRY